MTGEDVIKQVQENASEWLEMSENPTELMVGILATTVAELSNYIKYLEKRVDYDSRTKHRIN